MHDVMGCMIDGDGLSAGVSQSDNGECSADVLECLTPSLQDKTLHKMLANVARQDKNYVGREMLSDTESEGTSFEGKQT